MPSQPDIEERIEQIIQAHRPKRLRQRETEECQQGCLYISGGWYTHLSSVLVSELLTAEWALTSGGGRQKVMSERSAKDKAQRWPESFGVASRYVTKWADHA